MWSRRRRLRPGRRRRAPALPPAFTTSANVVSNLGVFDFRGPGRTMRLRSVPPGVSVADIVAATAFELTVPDDVAETPPPHSRGARRAAPGARPRLAARQVGLERLPPALTTELCAPAGRPLSDRADRDGAGRRTPPRRRHRQRAAWASWPRPPRTPAGWRPPSPRSARRTDAPFGVNLRTDVADVADRVALMIETGAQVASFAQAPNPALVRRCKAGLFVVPTVGARRHAEGG